MVAEVSNVSQWEIRGKRCEAMMAGIESSPMKKRHTDDRQICFVRHGQALHNVCDRNVWTPDNPLTEVGLQQCKSARIEWAEDVFEDADLIVTSPLTRAMQTAGALNGSLEDPRFLVTPLCTERWSATCDEGSRKSELLDRMPWLSSWQGMEDLAEEWWPTSKENVPARVNEFLKFLRKRPERRIVVVSHGCFLSWIVGHYMDNVGHHEVKMEDLRDARQ